MTVSKTLPLERTGGWRGCDRPVRPRHGCASLRGMAQSSFSHLNEFCAAGAMAAQARRAERERRENLLDAGVCDDDALWPSAIAEVDDVHFIDATWLTDEFMASLPAARGNGRRGASGGLPPGALCLEAGVCREWRHVDHPRHLHVQHHTVLSMRTHR